MTSVDPPHAAGATAAAASDALLDMCVVLVTAPSEAVAVPMAHALVDEKLVACVNIVPALRSIYAWDGKICDEAEVLCIAKTRRSLFSSLVERVRALHPYQVPEIVALDVANASLPYYEWLLSSTQRALPVPSP